MADSRLALVCALACLPTLATAAGPRVRCHYSYGGEERVLVAVPVHSPYGVAAIPVGSYFRFRVVFQTQPRDQAGVHIYTYADREEGLVPLHQASYAYPLAAGGAHGFTGLQFVYEPVRDGEFQYWCALGGAGAERGR